MINQAILTINDKKFYPADKNDLINEINNLENYKNKEFAEIWLSLNKQDTPSLCILVNKERAFVMYLRYNGDVGYTSRDLTKSNTTEKIDFYLANGQLDKYPLFSTIPIQDAIKALQYFYLHQNMDPIITWYNDNE